MVALLAIPLSIDSRMLSARPGGGSRTPFVGLGPLRTERMGSELVGAVASIPSQPVSASCPEPRSRCPAGEVCIGPGSTGAPEEQDLREAAL